MDPAFVDYAWEQMRAQLDEAMPVEDGRRKRGWWLWLLLFVVLGSAGVSLRTFGPKEVEETPQPLPQEAPIAVAESSSEALVGQVPDLPAGTSTAPVEQASVANEPGHFVASDGVSDSPIDRSMPPVEQLAASSVAPTKSNPALIDAPRASVAQKTADGTSGDAPSESASFSPDSATSAAESPVAAQAGGRASEAPTATFPLLAVEQKVVNAKEDGGLMAAVPTLALQPDKKASSVSLPAAANVAKNPIHFFAEGTLGAGLDDQAQLLHLGAGAQLALSPQMAIEGGLAYQAYHLGELKLFSGEQDALLINFEDINQGAWGGANNAVTVPFDSAVSSVMTHRIAMPLNVRWSPSPQSPWQFSLGGSAAYYLQAQVESELPESFSFSERSAITNFDLYNEDQPLLVFDASAEDISSPTGAAASPLEITRWEWSWTVALGYRFSGRIEGQVQYRGLLNDWPNSREQLGPHSFVQLSLRYYLQ